MGNRSEKGRTMKARKDIRFHGGPKDGLHWEISGRVQKPKRILFQYDDSNDRYVYANRPEAGEALDYFFKGVESNGGREDGSLGR